MPRFIYKAVAAGGEVLDGEITAENREAAMTRIRAQGVVPVSCEQRKAPGGGLRAPPRRTARGRFDTLRPAPPVPVRLHGAERSGAWVGSHGVGPRPDLRM